MLKHQILSLMCIASLTCSAFPASHYTQQSILSSGKWVKISIPTDGVYELTAQELKEMGFSNPENVQIYGNGGHMLSENLDGTAIDDLKPISTAVLNGKLVFYGCGPVKVTMNDNKFASFSRTINPYSTRGYYFLTEGKESKRVVVQPARTAAPQATTYTTSYDYLYHEQELMSLSSSGKTLLGEDLTSGCSFNITLPNNSSPIITLNTSAAIKLHAGTISLDATITSPNTGQQSMSLSKTKEISSNTIFYSELKPSTSFSTEVPFEQGTLTFSLSKTNDAQLIDAKLDNFILGYSHTNSFTGCHNGQLRMAFSPIDDGDRVLISHATSAITVWNIDNPTTPIAYTVIEGEQGLEFITDLHPNNSEWVAFTPSNTLMKIEGFEHISNQNLHAMEVPDMLIITNKTFLSEAQRLATFHNENDGIEVAVVDQEHIFNEFSSGTPDAMAYRLLCKMLYDRDSEKFKYLLLLGEGSYDNRGIASVKENRILTYQSDNSNNENSSLVTDDFFGFLDDNTGGNIVLCKLSLGIGRIPSASVLEAKNDIDKLIKYVSAGDYGPWRNNIFLSAEYKDENHPDLHESQAECIAKIIAGTLKTGMNIDKAYVDMFPKSVNDEFMSEGGRTSSIARQHFAEALHRGQYFASYVGHAGPRGFSNSKLWTTNEVLNHRYDQLPIFTTACCEVARFDDDTRGIAEHMFHKKNGGAIALLTSTRQVISTSNDDLNRAWIKSMFSGEPGMQFPTLGDILLNAKTSMSNSSNNMKFLLLGDPAMRIGYPVPLFELTHVGGNDISTNEDVHAQPLQPIEIKGRVLKPDRSGVDTDFNGEATVTILDKERFFKKASDTFTKYITDIYYPREILTQVQGKVVNGEFTATVVLPRYCRAINEKGLLQVYAHNPDNHFMVNGMFENLIIDEYNDITQDTQSPIITSMYLNDEQASQAGATVSTDATLYIHATDDLAINTQSLSMGNNMRLVLDGGKTSYYLVNNYVTVTDDGKALDLSFPLTGLSQGEHTLTFTIHDAAGNTATRTLPFIVGNASQLQVSVEEMPAITQATIHATSTVNSPNLHVKITDALGELVWQTTTASTPVIWDLNDMYGRRVSGGRYKVYCNYTDGSTVSGSNVADLIVTTKRKNPIKR